MIRKLEKLIGQKGSMMVEALAMLGLISMVTPVLYKKAAERTTELQDINSAAQMRTMSKALDDFIKDNYLELTTSTGGDLFDVSADEIQAYLPYGFRVDDSKFFDGYKMVIKRNIVEAGTSREHTALTGLVVAPLKGELPALRTAKIASMIGANGGVYRDRQFTGVQGGWEAVPGDYGFGDGAFPEGSIASTSVHAINASSGAGSDHVLFRDNSQGDAKFNTMEVDLFMGGNNIGEVHRLIADSANGTPEVIISGSEDDNTEANLIVKGMSDIKGMIKAGSANIGDIFKVDVNADPADPGTVTASARMLASKGLKVSGTGVGTGGDKTLEVSGESEFTGKLSAKTGAEIENGLQVKGGTISNAMKYSLAVLKSDEAATDGSLLVQNNLDVGGNFQIDGAFKAGKRDDGTYNFTADKDDVEVAGNFSAGDGGGFKLLNVTPGSGVVVSTDSTIASTKMVMEPATAGLYYGNPANYESKVEVTSSKAELASSGASVSTAGDVAEMQAGDYGLIADNGASPYAGVYGLGGAVKVNSYSAALKSDNADVTVNNGASGYVSIGANSKTGTSSFGVSSNSISANITSTATSSKDYLSMSMSERGMDMMWAKNNLPQSRIEVWDGKINVDNKNLYIDDDKLVLHSERASVIANTDKGEVLGGITSTGDAYSGGLILRREGMIQLPRANESLGDTSTGRVESSGYIQADRLLANKAFDKLWTTGAYDSGDPSKSSGAYDAYQVNPAYTSVMHDIKLATRGGARLSDILPDFINKGIYVIDNTYEEEENKKDWEKYTPQITNGVVNFGADEPGSCSSYNCITTPWLGFVPAPQCPPGYSKVITINPIRWKMAEAYSIAMNPTGVDDIAEKFKAYFVAHRNPATARFELEETTASDGTAHTHDVKQGMPLTFQTNTWLNTTIGGVRADQTQQTTGTDAVRESNFLGWHAIMGFLYHGSDYSDYLTSAGGSTTAANLNGKIVWNIFPVYKEELTAIADVYCYFERRSISGTTAWTWDEHYVDSSYNQLTNFRSGFDKGTTAYEKRLNDPALKYTDPW